MPRYGTVDRGYGMRLATCEPDADGGIYLLNLMKYRDEADYGGAGAGVSGREADDRYSPVDVLHDIGAAICFAGDVVEASEDWDRVAVVRYATRRSFIEMQSRKDFQDKHIHKDAGMDHTIVLGTLPVGDLPTRAKPQRVLLEVWHGDPPPPAGPASTFEVEGTIVGDGRPWSGARWSHLAGDATAPAGSPTHQVLVLRPTIDRWV